MGMLYKVKSSVVTRNQWIILSSIIVCLKPVKNITFISKFLRIPCLSFFYHLASVVAEVLRDCDFSQNKSCKTYLPTMLPPSGRKGG